MESDFTSFPCIIRIKLIQTSSGKSFINKSVSKTTGNDEANDVCLA